MPDLTSTTTLAVVVAALLVGVGSACGPAVIARLPEPRLDSDRDGKVAYRDLVTSPGLVWKFGVAGVVTGVVVGWGAGWSPVLPTWVLLGVVGVWLAYVDWRTRLLPTTLIAPAHGGVLVMIGLAAVLDGTSEGLVRSVLGWAAMGGFYLVSWLVYRRGIGYGDVRLAGVLGLALGYLGWAELLLGLYAAFVCGMAVGLVSWAARRGRTYPFGPCMLVGALAGLVWGAVLGDWYAAL